MDEEVKKTIGNRVGKSIVFIDGSNLHYSLKEADWEIDYFRMHNFLRSELFGGFDAVYFEGYFPDKAPGLNLLKNKQKLIKTRKEAKFRFFKKLREFGFIIETKPINSVYDFTSGDYHRKCNFDVEITIKALEHIDKYNTFVFFSGDGDFTKLVKYLKGKYKQVIVIGTKKRTSQSLQQAANQYINLNNLKAQIERKQKALP